MARSLDTDIIQVLIDFPQDDNFTWHQRLLLVELGPGRWVAATPDFGIGVLDLSQHKVIPLARSAPWPPNVRNDVYGFDPLSDDQRDDIFVRANQLAKVLGHKGTAAQTSAGLRWRIADPGHTKFNQRAFAIVAGVHTRCVCMHRASARSRTRRSVI